MNDVNISDSVFRHLKLEIANSIPASNSETFDIDDKLTFAELRYLIRQNTESLKRGSDFRRQILTSKVDPHTERVKEQ